jgi:hypothetical protein
MGGKGLRVINNITYSIDLSLYSLDRALGQIVARQIVADKPSQKIRRTDKTLQGKIVAWVKKKCKLFNHIRRIHLHLLNNVISSHAFTGLTTMQRYEILKHFIIATFCLCDYLSLQRFVRNDLSATICPHRFVLQHSVRSPFK